MVADVGVLPNRQKKVIISMVANVGILPNYQNKNIYDRGCKSPPKPSKQKHLSL